jgi:hypothetical protein
MYIMREGQHLWNILEETPAEEGVFACHEAVCTEGAITLAVELKKTNNFFVEHLEGSPR